MGAPRLAGAVQRTPTAGPVSKYSDSITGHFFLGITFAASDSAVPTVAIWSTSRLGDRIIATHRINARTPGWLPSCAVNDVGRSTACPSHACRYGSLLQVTVRLQITASGEAVTGSPESRCRSTSHKRCSSPISPRTPELALTAALTSDVVKIGELSPQASRSVAVCSSKSGQRPYTYAAFRRRAPWARLSPDRDFKDYYIPPQ